MFFLQKNKTTGPSVLGFTAVVGGQGSDAMSAQGLAPAREGSERHPPKYLRRIAQLTLDDFRLVGGQAAWMGELSSQLASSGVGAPEGFVLTAEACSAFFEFNQLTARIGSSLAHLADCSERDCSAELRRIQRWILDAELPPNLSREIADAYSHLERRLGFAPKVAVKACVITDKPVSRGRESAAETQFAWHASQLADAVKRSLALIFTERFWWRRLASKDKLIAFWNTGYAITVTQCADSRRVVSGFLSTVEPESGFADVLVVNAAYGYGDYIARGGVDPDEFRVYKPALELAVAPILKREMGAKARRLVYTDDGRGGVAPLVAEVPQADRKRFAITDDELLLLSRQAVAIEKHAQRRLGRHVPIELEWELDGVTGQILLIDLWVGASQGQHRFESPLRFEFLESGWDLATGLPVGFGIASGRGRIVRDASDLASLAAGDIVVAEYIEPDWEPALSKAAAIVTDLGGRFSNAARLAREWNIPAVIGCGDATSAIVDGAEVTVSAVHGEAGFVYDRKLAFRRIEMPAVNVEDAQTQIMLNLTDPERAFDYAAWSVHGVGLVRMEFIIDRIIRVHPRLLLEYEGLEAEMQFTVDKIVQGYPSRKDYFVQRLAESIGSIAAAFNPRPVTVRFSDFKSNEYSALFGGDHVERHESNPLVGMRGARRFISKEFVACFAMECEAIRIVRERMGLRNVHVVVPLVRTVEEARKVLSIMQQAGLRRNDNDLRVTMMCETPANALLADEFLPHFDGISIGTNDLTQLALGIDRESDLFRDYDERNRAVLKLMNMAIEAARRHGKPVCVSGCALAEYPEIVRWFVERRVDGLSVDPDRFFEVARIVVDTEEQVYGPKTEELKPFFKSTA